MLEFHCGFDNLLHCNGKLLHSWVAAHSIGKLLHILEFVALPRVLHHIAM